MTEMYNQKLIQDNRNTLTKISPKKWLQELNKAIVSASCKMENEETNLNEGLNYANTIIERTIESGASIWWVGNGGSAAICSHLAQDALNRLGAKSIFLDNSSLITCMANDFSYKNVYLRPLEIFVKPDDLLIAISSSGNSKNILSCAEMALNKRMGLISLSGLNNNNKLWNMRSNLSFFISSDLYGIVEIAHEAILHGIIESLWLNLSKKER